MTRRLEHTLSLLISGLSTQARTLLIDTNDVKLADALAFLKQAQILLTAFEEAVKAGSDRPEWAIRNLDVDTKRDYDDAKIYVKRLQTLFGAIAGDA